MAPQCTYVVSTNLGEIELSTQKVGFDYADANFKLYFIENIIYTYTLLNNSTSNLFSLYYICNITIELLTIIVQRSTFEINQNYAGNLVSEIKIQFQLEYSYLES